MSKLRWKNVSNLLLDNILLQKNFVEWRFSVKWTYQVLTQSNHTSTDTHPHIIWNKWVSLKVSLFVWRIFNKRVPQRIIYFVVEWCLLVLLLCARGCGIEETITHLFLGCDIFGRVGNLVLKLMIIYFVHFADISVIMPCNLLVAICFGRMLTWVFQELWLTYIWFIWKEHNLIFSITKSWLWSSNLNALNFICGGGWRISKQIFWLTYVLGGWIPWLVWGSPLCSLLFVLVLFSCIIDTF